MGRRFNPQLPVFEGPVFRLRFRGLLFGQNILNTLYYGRATGAGTTIPTAAALVESVALTIETSWVACVSTLFTMEDVIVDRMDDPFFPPTIVDVTWTGVREFPPDRSFVQFQVRRFTNWVGQRARGEIRIAGISEEDSEGNEVTAAQAARIVTFAGALQTNVDTPNPTDGTWNPMLVTRTIALTPVAVATVRGLPVYLWEGQRRLSTQKSRLPKGEA